MRHRLLLLLALMAIPFMAQAQKHKTKGTAIVAHRGFWNCEEAGFARNSLAALKCAQEAGFWGSEFDVNMTSDGVLLVFHDGNVEGRKIEKHHTKISNISDLKTESRSRRWTSISSRERNIRRRSWFMN